MPLTSEEAATAVRLARRAVATHLAPGAPRDPATPFDAEELPPLFAEARGVFVTWKVAGSDRLRGCIGYPLPVEPLRRAIPHVAVAAAVEDPRFPPVLPDELPTLTAEVSVLTVPALLDAAAPGDRLAAVRVGRDGLIVRARGTSGLLLPQVAVEEGWDAATFLAGACEKAGLPLDAWRDLRTRIYRFQADVVRETRPGGPVEAVALTPAPAGRGPRG